VLLDRNPERELLDRLLARVRRGQSAVLVIRGEAGIGKTALLRYAARQASDFHVAHIAGVEAEMEMPFAGVHQACTPLLTRLEALPKPQQEALTRALGMSSGDPPDRFLVGLAVLSLMSAAGEERPLLCLVDDAQWLDAASAQELGFVGRRLLAESVALVVAFREPAATRDFEGLPELPVGGLSEDAARELLARAIPGRVDDRVRNQIVAETRGNPLALLELPRDMSAAEVAGGFNLLGGGDLHGHIEKHYLRRVEALPELTQRLMLLAAADPVGDAALLWRAAGKLGIETTALASAEDADLLEVGARVRFRHPLVRSAVYRSAPAEGRREAHLVLADVIDAEVDPDRRAWHLAAAARGPDERVALELESSASRAQARGGLAAAAAFLQRAFELTNEPTRRVERALAAAQASLNAGAFDATLELLTTAEIGALDDLQRARIELLRAQLAFASSRGAEVTPLLLAAARRLESLDVSLARETYVDAFASALFGARLNIDVGVRDVADAARVAPRRADGDSTIADLLLDALVALTDDYDRAVPLCREALQRLSGESIPPKERLRWLWHGGGVVALEVWDDESAYRLLHHNIEIARETGRLSALALALSAHTPVLVLCGELSAAASAVAETQSVEEATGISSAPYGALILQAWQGKPRKARELIETTIRDSSSRGEGIGVATSEYARAVLCNSLGEYDAALVAACSASEYQEVVAENWGLSELIEPAIRTGRTDLATDALRRVARKAHATGTDWALGIEARSKALLSEGSESETGFREAIEYLGRTRVRAELARTHLLYGEWLRREGRRGDARGQLRLAHERFARSGMEGFADRARVELQATGEKVRQRRVETRDDLTAQERRIAQLAGDGLSNPEIGARLFLSPRTVEWHLHKVFAKLGIRSRRALAGALAVPEAELGRT
jgi:DNA-binding CsgD family transcriptional regulator